MLLFSFDCLDCWGEEVRSMNVGKVGATFKYPHSFIANLKDIKYFFGCGDTVKLVLPFLGFCSV